MENKKHYEAPRVRLLKFDAKDVLATSPGWNFNCQSFGGGDNAMPSQGCSIETITDNSQN